MITITHEAIIQRPAPEVFAFIADCANDPLWCPPVLAAEQTGGDGPALGAQYRQAVKPGPQKLTNHIEIVEYDPPRRVAWEGRNESAVFHGHYELEALNGSTRVLMTSNITFQGWMRLLRPIIAWASRKTAAEEFENLKQLLEAQPEKEVQQYA